MAVKVWNIEGEKEVHTLKRSPTFIRSLVVTSDGGAVITAEWDNLYVWSLRHRASKYERPSGSEAIGAIAVSGDGKKAVSASSGGIVKVWSLQRCEEIGSNKCFSHVVNALSITPDSSVLISASFTPLLVVWDINHKQLVCQLKGHRGYVSSIALAANGRVAVSSSLGDGTIKVWDLRTATSIHTLSDEAQYFTAVGITPDGRIAVSAAHRGPHRVIKGTTEDVICLPPGLAPRYRRETVIVMWDLVNGRIIRRLGSYALDVNSIAIAPDVRIAILTSENGRVRILNLNSGAVAMTFTGDEAIRSCAITPDGRTAIVGDRLGKIHFFHLEGV